MAKKLKDIGIGRFSSKHAKKVISNNGITNVVHLNKSKDIGELFTFLINVSWTRFFVYVLFGYIFINIFFGLIYLAIGIEQITTRSTSIFFDFLHAFFFSAQTVTTVGYGGISPKGEMAGIVSTIEALLGLLSFSFITGLLYGRFSKPYASISFSKHIILRSFNEGFALMFKLKNNRTTMLIEPIIKVNIAITDTEKGDNQRSFYELALERDQIIFLPTAWTIVHPCDEKSPFYGKSMEEIGALHFEIFILLKYFDEGFNQNIYKSFSYDHNDLLLNKKFQKSLIYDDEGQVTLDHLTFDQLEEM